MIRMEIALILVLLFIACMYFSAERPHTLLHKIFSVLLITVIVHLIFDAATIYTVNHLDSVPAILNRILHRMFIGTMALVVYLFYQYIAILVQEETGKIRQFIQAAERACCLGEQTANPFALPGFRGCCRDPFPVWRAVPAMHGSKLNINFRQMSRIEKDRERMPP